MLRVSRSTRLLFLSIVFVVSECVPIQKRFQVYERKLFSLFFIPRPRQLSGPVVVCWNRRRHVVVVVVAVVVVTVVVLPLQDRGKEGENSGER